MTAIAYKSRMSAIACIALALGGCRLFGADPPAPPLTVVAAEPDRPVIAGECWAPDPAEPKLPDQVDATVADVVRHIEARRTDRRTLVRLRRVCRASLAASFGDPSHPRVASANPHWP